MVNHLLLFDFSLVLSGFSGEPLVLESEETEQVPIHPFHPMQDSADLYCTAFAPSL